MVAQSRSSGARHVVMRELNRSLVLDLLKERSPISRAALAEASSLAKPTVSGIVEELLAQGIVREVGVGSTTREGGRPPVLLQFDALSQCLAGVHVGVTTTTIVLADALGHEFHRMRMPTGRGRPERLFGRVVDAIREAVDTTGVTDRELAIGVCVPGLTEAGVCRLAPNLGWSDVPVRDLLGGALDVPTYVHNSAQAAAVAEAIEGAARGADDVVLLYLGSGVGSGWLTGGRLFPGATGLAGELGHCAVDGSTERCPCGRVGCLEAVASGIAIARDAKRAIAAGRASSLSTGRKNPTVEQVAEAAAAGDALSLELLSNAGRQLGIAASWLLNLTNPRVLVIAGGLTASGEALLGPLRQAADRHVLPQVRERVDIRMSELGADAEVRGAVLLARQYSETYYRVVFQGA
jgi:predicted NBD/HSP70 family sugar kinase